MSIVISKYNLDMEKIYQVQSADCIFLIFGCGSNSYGCKVDGGKPYAFACMSKSESDDPCTEILSKMLITLSTGEIPEKMDQELSIKDELLEVSIAVGCMGRSNCRGHYVVDFMDDDIVIHGTRDSYLITRKDELCKQNYRVMAMSQRGYYNIMPYCVADDEKPALAVYTAFMMDECVPSEKILSVFNMYFTAQDDMALLERFGLDKIGGGASEAAAEDVFTARESSIF